MKTRKARQAKIRHFLIFAALLPVHLANALPPDIPEGWFLGFLPAKLAFWLIFYFLGSVVVAGIILLDPMNYDRENP